MAILRFHDLGIELTVGDPKSVLEAALEELIELRHNCGGLGMCTTCRIQVVAGAEHLEPPNDAELRRLGLHRLERGWRLACQTIVHEDLAVRLPRYA
ncbi:MAG: (2Fe-2S)-binding protein [Gemmatimonadetes bacterium]|nr:(2Fe-2S)-binding protein [Gemmatimonadota bacterium]